MTWNKVIASLIYTKLQKNEVYNEPKNILKNIYRGHP